MVNNKKNNNYIFFKRIISSNNNQGFTLIELLVVVIIVGILAAVALPNLLGQIGKARETEAKITLGVLARSQQGYHFENKTFYNGNDINVVGIGISGEYYAFTTDNTANQSKAIHTAYATNPSNDRARDFSVGVYYNAPQYSQTLCIATGVDSDGTTSSVTAQADRTCNRGNKIQ
ncbi:MAG TPA: prepilin-type N-terminal cleavage/methylation domain-containing protein [Coleofasciculaceae cyanobacterium]|jgi:type IV pilus assembly protein PilA